MKMDVVDLTETKKKGTGSEALGNYIHLFSGVKKKTQFFSTCFYVFRHWAKSLPHEPVFFSFSACERPTTSTIIVLYILVYLRWMLISIPQFHVL